MIGEWLTERYGETSVYYTHELDGGGRTYGQQFLPYLRHTIGPVEQALEWCAGPGFIGFSMLADGLCETLTLTDINPLALEAVTRTIDQNGLGTRVAAQLSDCLDDLPANATFDLVVANPPHSGTAEVVPHINRPTILYMDPGWAIHRRFYSQVGAFLRPGGSVVVQENSLFSSPLDFDQMIGEAGLEWVESVPTERGYYFIRSKRPS